MIRRSD